MDHIAQKPIVFIVQLLFIIGLSASIEIMAGGICIFKHGKMNIQEFTEQTYLILAGSDLSMSTEFSRQSGWLPGNNAGDSLCTYGSERQDICHVYLNPDKTNISNLILSVHLMESGRHIDDLSTYVFNNVSFEYW